MPSRQNLFKAFGETFGNRVGGIGTIDTTDWLEWEKESRVVSCLETPLVPCVDNEAVKAVSDCCL